MFQWIRGAIQCDPTEKKPFFHAYPGFSRADVWNARCDYHCQLLSELGYSQALRDPKAPHSAGSDPA